MINMQPYFTYFEAFNIKPHSVKFIEETEAKLKSGGNFF